MLRRILGLGFVILLVGQANADPLTLGWRDLLPKQLSSESTVPYGEQVRGDLDEQSVRIPGYIVPLEYDDDRAVTRFLLVPYFGACIHEPPPPPNQTIYAEFDPGVEVKSIWYPYWIEGEVSVSQVNAALATASYSINVDKVESYEQ